MPKEPIRFRSQERLQRHLALSILKFKDELFNKYGAAYDAVHDLETRYAIAERKKEETKDYEKYSPILKELSEKIDLRYKDLSKVFDELIKVRTVITLRIFLLTILKENTRWTFREIQEKALTGLISILKDKELREYYPLILRTLIKKMSYGIGDHLRGINFDVKRILPQIIKISPEYEKELCELMLKAEDVRVKQDIFEVISESGTKQSIIFLEQYLNHENPSVRGNALVAISMLDPELAYKLIEQRLKDKAIGSHMTQSLINIIRVCLGKDEKDDLFFKSMNLLVKTNFAISMLVAKILKQKKGSDINRLRDMLEKKILMDETADYELPKIKDEFKKMHLESRIKLFLNKLLGKLYPLEKGFKLDSAQEIRDLRQKWADGVREIRMTGKYDPDDIPF